MRKKLYFIASLFLVMFMLRFELVQAKEDQDKNSVTITLPEGVDSVGGTYFYGYTKLESITLPSSLKHFNDEDWDIWFEDNVNPFKDCTSLKEINVDKNNPDFCSEKGVLYSKDKTKLYCVPPAYPYKYTIPSTVKMIMQGAFASQKMLKEISIPDSVTYLGPLVFYNAVSIEKVNLTGKIEQILQGTFYKAGIKTFDIPEGMKTIADDAFWNCKRLKSVYVSKSLREFWRSETGSPFAGCTSLEEITVANGSEFYYSESGALFSQDELICYPALKKGATFTMPQNIGMGTGAFGSCKYLREVIIPEGTNYVFANFSDCENLKVYFPRSIKSYPDEGHAGDFPLFSDCRNCYAMVYKDSDMYEYCLRDKIPYKIRRDK